VLVAVLMLGSACTEAKPAPSTSTKAPAAKVYDPCSLLTAEQLTELAGTEVPEFGQVLSAVPERSCMRQDVLSVTEWSVRVSFDVMRASQWAATIARDVDTSPDAEKARDLFEAALKESGMDEEQLVSVNDDQACAFWRSFARVRGLPDSERLSIADDNSDLGGITRGQACDEGTYVEVVVQSEDKVDRATARRVADAVEVLLRSADRLPD